MSESINIKAVEMQHARRCLLEEPASVPAVVARHYMSLAMMARTLDQIATTDTAAARELIQLTLSEMADAHRKDFGCEPAWSKFLP